MTMYILMWCPTDEQRFLCSGDVLGMYTSLEQAKKAIDSDDICSFYWILEAQPDTSSEQWKKVFEVEL